jgi:hypothetical protein
MLLTIFLAIVFCAAITLVLISAVVFIKDKRLFSSAPKEALELVTDRKEEIETALEAAGFCDATISKKDNLYLVIGRK